ncbi:MAG: EAL domain-containing protein [Eubacteriales bacterium]|nr:EAL domain-containing protein [Eubacteriales bacterium]
MNSVWDNSGHSYGETEINESLKRMISENDPDRAVESLLAYLGEKCRCERSYIFEKRENETVCNTYEWCAQGIAPQKDFLQEEPLESIRWWWDLFENDYPVIIRDLEDIKDSHPDVYATLKVQDIHSLVTVAIRLHGELIGFLGVDNAEEDKIDPIADFLSGIVYFLSYVIERRDLNKKLEYLSYHDQLTGAFNRHAYSEFIKDYEGSAELGIVFCDITGLKQTNDNMGHIYGDKLIIHWHEVLKAVFPNEKIYRIGGDEFVVFSLSQGKEMFHKSVSQLEELVYKNQNHMAVGSVWVDEVEKGLSSFIHKAEKAMYKDKSVYYSQTNPVTGQSRDRRQNRITANDFIAVDIKREVDVHNEIGQFLKSNYFDPIAFFKAISMSDYYPFIGDLQSNLFYISDEMRDTFGFQSNIVSDFLGAWEKRIADQEDLEMFRRDITNVLSGNKAYHDLRYRVKDRADNNLWVHSHGIIKWDNEHKEALFVAGGVSRQEQQFIVDAITNFPKEFAAAKKIRELQHQNSIINIIGFTLNNFSELNELRGRHAANIFLNKVSKKLLANFGNKLRFYRLDGLRFIAIVLPNVEDTLEELIHELKDIISRVYYSNNIVVQVPCSIGIIQESGDESLPQDILVNMTALLNQAKHMPEKAYLVHSQKNLYSQKTRAQLIMELNKNVVDNFKNFRIVIQPVVSTETMGITSGEVLLRWSFEGKDISPTVFVPMLENSRLILQVGRWVLEQAIRHCKRINMVMPDFRLAVNISYYQILDKEFLPFLEETLQKYNLSGERLILEITETHYDETPTMVRQFVENCKALGIEVAIDDFGDGYSSLAFLIKYPATIVKLDRSLISEMVSSEDNINFIASIVYACHKFGKKVCAEGVETKDEFEILRDSGCDMIQGYYFHKPLELIDFYSKVNRQHSERVK